MIVALTLANLGTGSAATAINNHLSSMDSWRYLDLTMEAAVKAKNAGHYPVLMVNPRVFQIAQLASATIAHPPAPRIPRQKGLAGTKGKALAGGILAGTAAAVAGFSIIGHAAYYMARFQGKGYLGASMIAMNAGAIGGAVTGLSVGISGYFLIKKMLRKNL